MRNLPEWSIAFFAARRWPVRSPCRSTRSGTVPSWPSRVDDCAPKVLVADGERLERLGRRTPTTLAGDAGRRHPPRRPQDRRRRCRPASCRSTSLLERPAVGSRRSTCDPDDLATIFYTSGTTSHPKGVLGTHRNICANVVEHEVRRRPGQRCAPAVDRRPSRPSRRSCSLPVPLFHATGCHSNLVAQAFFGRHRSCSCASGIRRPRSTSSSASGSRACPACPTMAWDLVNAPSIEGRDLSSLRSLGGGGAAAPPELLRRIQSVLPGRGAGTGYGMTESSSLTTSIGGADYVARPTSVGVPVPICDVRIVDDDGSDVPVGAVGEIWIAGPTVVPGYWHRPEDTARDVHRRVAALGRPRPRRRGGLPLHRRPGQGHGDPRRREHRRASRWRPRCSSTRRCSRPPCSPVPHHVLGEEVGAVVRLQSGRRRDRRRTACARGSVSSRRSRCRRTSGCSDEPFPRGATGKVLKRDLRRDYYAAGRHRWVNWLVTTARRGRVLVVSMQRRGQAQRRRPSPRRRDRRRAQRDRGRRPSVGRRADRHDHGVQRRERPDRQGRLRDRAGRRVRRDPPGPPQAADRRRRRAWRSAAAWRSCWPATSSSPPATPVSACPR